MLLLSMGVSVDGFIADRDGDFTWTVPDDGLFAFHTERVADLGAFVCGRRLYETMLVWETDPRMREDEADAAFADIWSALPKVVFSRTLTSVEGNARLAQRPLAEELAATMDSTDSDVEIGGADLAGQAIESGVVDEFRIFRYPIVVGGGKPFFPPVTRSISLELAETRTFGQVLYERYRRAHDQA
ncbi:dihydrofolate reductase family protein [Gordonia sp. 'Campus']|uniref:dihydrofolate reductase family protein n=1 Tax=Gordonia sp. 'Campus' TaxID=2915824 RepID=UPI001EE3C1D5|nr:dihydrofolate reductase family protein [Gordonia sp. 'Campus']